MAGSVTAQRTVSSPSGVTWCSARAPSWPPTGRSPPEPGLLGRAAIPYASRVDQLEAYAVGKKAVEAALAGETDYMVAIDAHRGERYSFDLFLAPLEKVANVEKKFPLEWIVDGNKIDDRFFDYAMPLMMEKMPDYAILR